MIQVLFKKQENVQINNLTYNLKELEKEEQKKYDVSRRKEIIKIREEIYKIGIKQKCKRVKARFGFLKR